ncbi:MAG: hypothetical protein R3208_15130 [Ketobacteraceae bacterium]|nr:hypothetical protein [Ketobacteraceae bacterium]
MHSHHFINENVSYKYYLAYIPLVLIVLVLSPLELKDCKDAPVMFGLLIGCITGFMVYATSINLIHALKNRNRLRNPGALSAEQIQLRANQARAGYHSDKKPCIIKLPLTALIK